MRNFMFRPEVTRRLADKFHETSGEIETHLLASREFVQRIE
jgi:hypothetical protein